MAVDVEKRLRSGPSFGCGFDHKRYGASLRYMARILNAHDPDLSKFEARILPVVPRFGFLATVTDHPVDALRNGELINNP